MSNKHAKKKAVAAIRTIVMAAKELIEAEDYIRNENKKEKENND